MAKKKAAAPRAITRATPEPFDLASVSYTQAPKVTRGRRVIPPLQPWHLAVLDTYGKDMEITFPVPAKVDHADLIKEFRRVVRMNGYAYRIAAGRNKDGHLVMSAEEPRTRKSRGANPSQQETA